MRKNPAQLDLIDLLAAIEARPRVVQLPTSVWGRTIWGNKVAEIAQAMTEKPEMARRVFDGSQFILSRGLKAAGASDADILSELARYRTAVTLELSRRRSAGHQSGPSAA